MTGTAAQEIDDWPLPRDIDQWTWTDYESYLFEHLSAFNGDLAARVQSLYAKRGTPELVFTSLVSDLRETCPVSAVAMMLDHYWRQPVYRYVVNFTTADTNSGSDAGDVDVMQHRGESVRASFRYSYHSIDMYHFFSSTGAVPSSGQLAYHSNIKDDDVVAGTSQQQQQQQHEQFRDVMRQTVFEFARTGRLEGWLSYPRTKLLSSQIADVQSNNSYRHEQCELWRANAMFPDYAWMN